MVYFGGHFYQGCGCLFDEVYWIEVILGCRESLRQEWNLMSLSCRGNDLVIAFYYIFSFRKILINACMIWYYTTFSHWFSVPHCSFFSTYVALARASTSMVALPLDCGWFCGKVDVNHLWYVNPDQAPSHVIVMVSSMY